MLRLHLPPNLSAAVSRDAVALKVELDLAGPPAAALLPVLALLQRWCGTPTPPKFIQLSRVQLRELTAAAGHQPIFVESNGPPSIWAFSSLLGTTEPAEVAPPAPIPKRQAKPEIVVSPMIVDGTENYLAITAPSRDRSAYPAVIELLRASEQGAAAGAGGNPGGGRRVQNPHKRQTSGFRLAAGTEVFGTPRQPFWSAVASGIPRDTALMAD